MNALATKLDKILFLSSDDFDSDSSSDFKFSK